MSEERVVIDGIDVTDCEHYHNVQRVMHSNNLVEVIPEACTKTMVTQPCGKRYCLYKKYDNLKKQYDNLMDINMHLQDKIKELKLQRCPNCNEEFLTPEGSKLLDEIWDLREENKSLLDKIKELKGETKDV